LTAHAGHALAISALVATRTAVRTVRIGIHTEPIAQQRANTLPVHALYVLSFAPVPTCPAVADAGLGIDAVGNSWTHELGFAYADMIDAFPHPIRTDGAVIRAAVTVDVLDAACLLLPRMDAGIVVTTIVTSAHDRWMVVAVAVEQVVGARLGRKLARDVHLAWIG